MSGEYHRDPFRDAFPWGAALRRHGLAQTFADRLLPLVREVNVLKIVAVSRNPDYIHQLIASARALVTTCDKLLEAAAGVEDANRYGLVDALREQRKNGLETLAKTEALWQSELLKRGR